MLHGSLVWMGRGGVALKRKLETLEGRSGHSCSCQYTEENSSSAVGGGRECRCKQHQSPLVCDVSTAAKNSTAENYRGCITG